MSSAELVERVAERTAAILLPSLLKSSSSKDPNDLLTAKEASLVLRCSLSSLSRFTRGGHLRSCGPKSGRAKLFRRGDLEAFIADHRR